jgi:hypothetical protein
MLPSQINFSSSSVRSLPNFASSAGSAKLNSQATYSAHEVDRVTLSGNSPSLDSKSLKKPETCNRVEDPEVAKCVTLLDGMQIDSGPPASDCKAEVSRNDCHTDKDAALFERLQGLKLKITEASQKLAKLPADTDAQEIRTQRGMEKCCHIAGLGAAGFALAGCALAGLALTPTVCIASLGLLVAAELKALSHHQVAEDLEFRQSMVARAKMELQEKCDQQLSYVDANLGLLVGRPSGQSDLSHSA